MTQTLLDEAPTFVVGKTLQETFGFKSPHTAKKYIGYLKQAYLLVGLQKYSPKSKIRLSREKVYPIDVALMNNRTNAFAGDNLGWRLETIAYLHLLRKYSREGCDIYYYSERTGECDFVICKGREAILAVQVSYDISAERTKKRELAGLIKAARATGCTNLLLLTDHQSEDITLDGYTIAIRPLYEYVLG
jgi:hypothetical protein